MTTFSFSLVHSIQFIVLIHNELQDRLGTHCIIEGFDNGVFTIPQGRFDDFPVNLNDPKQRANATCALVSEATKLPRPHGQFVVFDNIRDSKRCGNNKCEWHVKIDGLYLNIKGKQVKEFSWSS